MSNEQYYSVECAGTGDRVGDFEFEGSLTKLAKKCNGEFSGAGFGFGQRDFNFVFKTEKSGRKFFAALGRRKRMWRIKDRSLVYYDWDNEDNIRVILQDNLRG